MAARRGSSIQLMSFTHLHLHTLYSLLDGAIRMKDLVKTVREKGMTSVAVTDHGNMFGAIDFYRKAKDAGLKPKLTSRGPRAAEIEPRRFRTISSSWPRTKRAIPTFDIWFQPDTWTASITTRGSTSRFSRSMPRV